MRVLSALLLTAVIGLCTATPSHAQNQAPAPATSARTLTTVGNAHTEAIKKATERPTEKKKPAPRRTVEAPLPSAGR